MRARCVSVLLAPAFKCINSRRIDVMHICIAHIHIIAQSVAQQRTHNQYVDNRFRWCMMCCGIAGWLFGFICLLFFARSRYGRSFYTYVCAGKRERTIIVVAIHNGMCATMWWMTERALHIYGCLSILKLNCVFMKCSNPFGQHSSGDLLSVMMRASCLLFSTKMTRESTMEVNWPGNPYSDAVKPNKP